MKNLEIQKNDPYNKEKNELEYYESRAKNFYELFISDISNNSKLTEIQKESLLQAYITFQRELKEFEKKLKDFPRAQEKFDVIFQTKERYYQKLLQKFATYLSMICYGEVGNLQYQNFNKIKNFLRQAFEEIISVCEEDIPKYDLLFKELDRIRNTDNKVELYIGRDGIYAYEARRALDIARRRKFKREDLNKRKVLEIHPKYINYNSTIKEGFSEDERRRFLEDNGVYPEDDLVIFDTGYRGSIPEQILRTLGRKDPDIESRIKILGTDYYEEYEDTDINKAETEIETARKIRGRIVPGIQNNLSNYEHVGKIEERGKKFMTASGIYEDKNGKLKPAENPFFNEYFFEYTMIEITLRQYYFNREYFKN